MKERMERKINLRMPQEQYEDIEGVLEYGESVSEFIRKAIDALVMLRTLKNR